jgi:hypothetical protein
VSGSQLPHGGLPLRRCVPACGVGGGMGVSSKALLAPLWDNPPAARRSVLGTTCGVKRGRVPLCFVCARECGVCFCKETPVPCASTARWCRVCGWGWHSRRPSAHPRQPCASTARAPRLPLCDPVAEGPPGRCGRVGRGGVARVAWTRHTPIQTGTPDLSISKKGDAPHAQTRQVMEVPAVVEEERHSQFEYWKHHVAIEATVETMMLDSNAAVIDAHERPEILGAWREGSVGGSGWALCASPHPVPPRFAGVDGTHARRVAPRACACAVLKTSSSLLHPRVGLQCAWDCAGSLSGSAPCTVLSRLGEGEQGVLHAWGAASPRAAPCLRAALSCPVTVLLLFSCLCVRVRWLGLVGARGTASCHPRAPFRALPKPVACRAPSAPLTPFPLSLAGGPAAHRRVPAVCHHSLQVRHACVCAAGKCMVPIRRGAPAPPMGEEGGGASSRRPFLWLAPPPSPPPPPTPTTSQSDRACFHFHLLMRSKFCFLAVVAAVVPPHGLLRPSLLLATRRSQASCRSLSTCPKAPV